MSRRCIHYTGVNLIPKCEFSSTIPVVRPRDSSYRSYSLILEVLYDDGPRSFEELGRLNVSEIAKRIGTNYESTSTRLESQESEGVLRHIELERAKLYSFKESPGARAAAGFLEVWET